MSVASCRVSVVDLDGVEHATTVSAETLFEAVARGIKKITRHSWVGELPKGLAKVTVSQLTPGVEHTVQMQAFERWLESDGASPHDRVARQKIRRILAE